MSRRMKTLRKNDPKEYWKILNTGKSTKQPDIEFKELFNFFKDLNTLKETNEPENTLNFDPTITAELNENINSPITKDEIFKGIKNLKNNKAFGDDQVINEYMKTTSNQFVDIYEKLFNLFVDTGIVPESWLLGTMKPFYKNKGNTNDPKNYRPITILSCLGKLFTAILNNRLNTYSESFLLLNENQCGFRKGYSTLDYIYSIHAFFEIIKKKKKENVLRIRRLRKSIRQYLEGSIVV